MIRELASWEGVYSQGEALNQGPEVTPRGAEWDQLVELEKFSPPPQLCHFSGDCHAKGKLFFAGG